MMQIRCRKAASTPRKGPGRPRKRLRKQVMERKLSYKDANRIRKQDPKRKSTLERLAERHGVHIQTIKDALTYKTWHPSKYEGR